jgi:hypothetical protein
MCATNMWTILEARGLVYDGYMLPSREAVALVGVLDALRWRHILEINVEQRPWLQVIIYPRGLTKLELVLSTSNNALDPQEELRSLCEGILCEQEPWHENCRPIILSEGDSRFEVWKKRRRWQSAHTDGFSRTGQKCVPRNVLPNSGLMTTGFQFQRSIRRRC